MYFALSGIRQEYDYNEATLFQYSVIIGGFYYEKHNTAVI